MDAQLFMNPIALNSYRSLPEQMFSGDLPVATGNPQLMILNDGLLQEYEIADTWFRSAQGLRILSGHTVNEDNPPIAMAYAGHQFGHHVPLLGDGRAHMLGQMHTANGAVDIQLKGSGPTAFSRGGDGRATLASVLREYIISEAMAGLGIPTTRSLAVIETGDQVYREQREAGAILARTARSHIRIGSFQYAAESLGSDAVKALGDYVIDQHFPQLASEEHRYAQLLATVSERQASLIAQWMLVGFIHGVMNTDNVSVVGETIDFGPCAFMDEFDANKAFSSIDRRGRYAWAKQPGIGLWNLARLAETLLPLLNNDRDTAISIAETRLETFMPVFQKAFYGGLQEKLGLTDHTEINKLFADETLELLGEHAIDMTVFFETLTRVAGGEADQVLLELFNDQEAAQLWLTQWKGLRANHADTAQRMRRVNPAIIARNHRVEEALQAATSNNDLSLLVRLTAALRNPYECTSENLDLQTPPLPEQRVTATFCGT
jgi:uncharacterized protein YdiU (UPF0061 family)